MSQSARGDSAAAAAAAAAASGVSCAATGDAASSHRLNQQQQQQQRGDASGAARPTQSSQVSHHTVLHTAQSTPPPTTLPPPPNHFRSAAPMTSLAQQCGLVTAGDVVGDWRRDDAARLVRDGQALVALFRRLMDTFYVETLVWIYFNVLHHPAARRTRSRLQWLAVVTGRDLQQATSNVLTGFVAGYRQSRQAVNVDVEATLLATTPAGSAGRAGRLAGLAVELGVILNARQMMRSFAAVVRDLVFRTSFHAAALAAANASHSCHHPPTSRLYRYLQFTSQAHSQLFFID